MDKKVVHISVSWHVNESAYGWTSPYATGQTELSMPASMLAAKPLAELIVDAVREACAQFPEVKAEYEAEQAAKAAAKAEAERLKAEAEASF